MRLPGTRSRNCLTPCPPSLLASFVPQCAREGGTARYYRGGTPSLARTAASFERGGKGPGVRQLNAPIALPACHCPLRAATPLLQQHQQHLQVGGSETGNSRRLADAGWAYSPQLITPLH